MTTSATHHDFPDPAQPTETDHLTHLAIQAQAGSQTARDVLVNEILPLLFIVVRSAGVKNEADIWDVVQETILRVCQLLSSFNSTRGSLRNWITRIALNQVIDLWRSQKRRRVISLSGIDLGSDRDDPSALTERKELHTLVEKAMASLSPEQRQAILLRFQHGLSYAKLSEVLHIPIGTAGTRIRRGIQAVREQIAKAA